MRHLLQKILNLIAPNAAERRRRRAVQKFERTTIFNRQWYLEHYPDVAAKGIDPARHYLVSGWQEGRDPGPDFSTTAYLRANADVAALGVNPLLHYLEHGQAEGRGLPGAAATPRKKTAPIVTFGVAGPIATFPRLQKAAVMWRRHARSPAHVSDSIRIDGHFIGENRDEYSRNGFAATFDWFASVSGAADGPSRSDPGKGMAPAELLDGWFANRNLLRTRWRPTTLEGQVVRAIQFTGDGPVLVGEGFVTSELDLFDAKLSNPFFPVLYVFSSADGWIDGWQALLFPSQCRGGLHYPERLASHADTGGLRELNNRHIEELPAVYDEHATPLISVIEVDLRGANGTHPLFQSDFQAWLSRVARLIVRPAEGSNAAGIEYLTDAVRLEPVSPRPVSAGILTLPSDMVPSLSIVTGVSGAQADRHELSFFVSGEEQSQPSAFVRLPGDLPDGLPNDFIPLYPCMRATNSTDHLTDLPPLAIRMPRTSPLSEADLLVPIAPAALAPIPLTQAITFLVQLGRGLERDVVDGLRSLSVQDCGPLSIIIVGPASAAILELAHSLFGDVGLAPDIRAAVATIGTALVGYMGPGVVLHDRRAVTVMAGLLSEQDVSSASVVLVSVERRGHGWIVTTVDTAGTESGDAEYCSHLGLSMWRATLPKRRPPDRLWMSSKSELEAWLAMSPRATGSHLCTSLVTASFRPTSSIDTPEFRPPPATVASSIEELVG